MSEFRIELLRTHFEKCVVCTANTARGVDQCGPAQGDTNWSTPFDGGVNRLGNSFIAIYAELDTAHGGLAQVFVLSLKETRDGWRSFYELKNFELWGHSPRRTWLDLSNSVGGQHHDTDWESVGETDVPEEVVRIMEKAIDLVRAKYGQGKDFFRV